MMASPRTSTRDWRADSIQLMISPELYLAENLLRNSSCCAGKPPEGGLRRGEELKTTSSVNAMRPPISSTTCSSAEIAPVRSFEAHRAWAIGALACVDYVAINQWPMATDTIRLLRPNIFAKGSEYRDASKDRTGAISAEEHVVEEIGGRIAFTDDVVFSSST